MLAGMDLIWTLDCPWTLVVRVKWGHVCEMGSFKGPIKFVPGPRKSQARRTITGMLSQCLLVSRLQNKKMRMGISQQTFHKSRLIFTTIQCVFRYTQNDDATCNAPVGRGLLGRLLKPHGKAGRGCYARRRRVPLEWCV